MIALDTNVVVRIIVDDDPEQVRRAIQFISSNDVLLLTSVILEVEWVLRSIYKLDAETIVRSIKGFIALDSVSVEKPEAVLRAIEAYVQGMDFADAMHLACSSHCARFASFDIALSRDAQRMGGFIPVIAL